MLGAAVRGSRRPGALTGTRYYAFGGTTVALRDGTGVSYLIGDVQGSATVLIPAGDGTGDPDAVVASRNAYTPYGVTRGSDNLATDRGWLGQVEDASSGLTYLNARYYDPAIARFISPDPLMDPTDPRTLDPYRYADNNPVLFTDPSGLAPSCSGLTGQAYKNCSGYATTTYNYMTGKTTAKKNEELAKSGKAGVNKTTPKPKASKSGGSASGASTKTYKGVNLGKTDFVMGAFIEGQRAGSGWFLGDSDSHGDGRGFAHNAGTVFTDSRFSMFYSSKSGTLTLRVNVSCEYPETAICTAPKVTAGTFAVATDERAVRSLLPPPRRSCGWPGQEYCADAVPDWMVVFSGKNSALQSAGGLQSEFVPSLNLSVEGYTQANGSTTVKIVGSGFPSVELGTVDRAGAYTPVIQDRASMPSEWAGAGLLLTSRALSANIGP